MPVLAGGTVEVIPAPAERVSSQATAMAVVHIHGVYPSDDALSSSEGLWAPLVLGSGLGVKDTVARQGVAPSNWLRGWSREAQLALGQSFADVPGLLIFVPYQEIAGERDAATWRQAATKTPWWPATAEELNELSLLPSDWDSYGSPPPDAAAITEAITLLWKVMEADTAPPGLVPLSDGGLQLEWSAADGSVVEVITGSVEDRGIFIQDAVGNWWEGSLDLPADVDRLTGYLAGETALA